MPARTVMSTPMNTELERTKPIKRTYLLTTFKPAIALVRTSHANDLDQNVSRSRHYCSPIHKKLTMSTLVQSDDVLATGHAILSCEKKDSRACISKAPATSLPSPMRGIQGIEPPSEKQQQEEDQEQTQDARTQKLLPRAAQEGEEEDDASCSNSQDEKPRSQQETRVPLLKQLYKDCVSSFVNVTTEMLVPERVAGLLETVQQMRIEHLGFHRPPILRNGIAHMSIAETEDYSIGVFLLAPGATIPLHDHPDMCVVSNVLFGSVHSRSFDWVNPEDANHSCGADCHEVFNSVLTPNDTRTLFPHSGGNIHTFTAGPEGCAMLDVLGPPYDDHAGRPCDYYEVEKDTDGNEVKSFADGKLRYRLRQVEESADFHVRNLPYRGPQFGMP
jgi:hypothetical protein